MPSHWDFGASTYEYWGDANFQSIMIIYGINFSSFCKWQERRWLCAKRNSKSIALCLKRVWKGGNTENKTQGNFSLTWLYWLLFNYLDQFFERSLKPINRLTSFYFLWHLGELYDHKKHLWIFIEWQEMKTTQHITKGQPCLDRSLWLLPNATFPTIVPTHTHTQIHASKDI